VRVANVFTQRLGLSHPVIQAPLAGSGDTPELVAAVCNAGAIGFVGAAYMNPEQISAAGKAVRAQTSRPFGINLFAPVPSGDAKNSEAILSRLAPYFAEVGLPAPTLPKPSGHCDVRHFESQLAAALETGASCFSFTFGLIPAASVQSIKAKGMYLMGTATTVEEARQLEQIGVDAIVAQGSEAGGHRGTFAGDFASGMVGTMALAPQIVDTVRVPVIASGGIMDGRGIVAALALGASAVQMGTAFLTCAEAATSQAYREAILNAHEDQTRITRAFSGRPARGIVNRFMKEMELDHAGDATDAILSFDLQNPLTRPLRTAAARQSRAEFLSLWAGQGVRMARRQNAAELVARLAREMDAALASLQRSGAASGSPAAGSPATSSQD
jgi:nitronate monooxygenase